MISWHPHTLRRDQATIRRRLLISVLIVALARLLYALPVPGLAWGQLWSLQRDYAQLPGRNWFDVVALLHVGKLRNISLFSLGVLPYINACIIAQVLAFLLPGLERRFFGRRDGRKRQEFFVLVLTVILSAVYGARVATELQVMAQLSGVRLLLLSGPLLSVVVAVAVCAGVFFMLLLAALINGYGLGHGVGLLFAVEVAIRQVIALDQLAAAFARYRVTAAGVLWFAAALAVFIVVVRAVTRFSRPLRLCAPNRECFAVHVRPDWMGVWPLLISEAMIAQLHLTAGPALIGRMLGVLAVMTLLYGKIVFQPRRLYELVLLHRCCPQPAGGSLERKFNGAIVAAQLAALTVYSAMYFLPLLFALHFRVPMLAAGVFGAYGIIVLVGLLLDMRAHCSFYRTLRQSPITRWGLLSVLADEMEAEIALMCLRSHGIAVAVKPIHFRWVLPVRTVASEYCVYVAAAQLPAARALVGEWEQSPAAPLY